jgi:hypothetical protein
MEFLMFVELLFNVFRYMEISAFPDGNSKFESGSTA